MSTGNWVALTVMIGIISFLIGISRGLTVEFKESIKEILASVEATNYTLASFTKALIHRKDSKEKDMQ
jgi:hypothetical protein